LENNVEKKVKPQLLAKQEATGVMRGRDVRAKLLTRNIDPEVRTILETLAEINHTNVLAIAELATMQDQIINIIQNFANISQNMKDKMAQIQRSTQAEAEGDEGAETTKH
jgi:hypothetical protein